MMLGKLLKRDLKIYMGKKNEFLTLMFFFVLIISLFPLASGKAALDSAGIIWITALLYSLLSVRLYFDEDYNDGSLETLIVKTPLPSFIIAIKSLSHFIFCFLPLLPVIVISVIFLNTSANIHFLMASLCLGLLCISFINSMSSSFTLGLKNAAAISSIIILPLHIPVLIFGIGAAQASKFDIFIKNIYGLGALLLLLIPISVFASALAIKAAAED